jgi:hypothetical protein
MFELFSLKIPLNEIRVPTKMSRAARQEGCGEECRAALRYSSFSPADSYGTRTVRRVVWGNGFRTVLWGEYEYEDMHSNPNVKKSFMV